MEPAPADPRQAHGPGATLGQVAFCGLGGSRLRRWYRDGLGLLPSGATPFAGPPAAKVNGLPQPLFGARWLSDGRERVQIELFRFLHPKPRPRRLDETAADHGYRRVGFHVADFDATIAALAKLGCEPIGPVLGELPRRRACVRDPDGNWIELMEDDPLAARAPRKRWPDARATLRAVTISVPDLDAAVRCWGDGIGLAETPLPLHRADDEALWGLAGARRRDRSLDAGAAVIELVEYEDPAGRPVDPDRRLSDQGIMNVAFVVPDRETFDLTFARWVGRGFIPTSPRPLDAGVFRVMYFDLPSGENVELLYPRRWAWRLTGFVPASPWRTR